MAKPGGALTSTTPGTKTIVIAAPKGQTGSFGGPTKIITSVPKLSGGGNTQFIVVSPQPSGAGGVVGQYFYLFIKRIFLHTSFGYILNKVVYLMT